MALKLRYDHGVRTVSLSAVATFLALAITLPHARAQAFASGSGFGGGGHVAAPPPSIAARGFGHTAAPGFGNHFGFGVPARPGRFPNSIHHRPFYPAWGGYYGYPIFGDYGSVYPYDADVADNPPNDDDDYRGGPTIFDRRGAAGQFPAPGTNSYSTGDNAQERAGSQANDVTEQPETILVFKDGHQAEIDNYAIVGDTLFDLSGGQRHKIALSELDLRATAKQNDDRGVDFQLPAFSDAN